MTRRIEIPTSQLPGNGARSGLQIEGKTLALFNIDGTLYVIDDRCPHQGASLLAGSLQGRMLQCQSHGLRFDLASGCMSNASAFGVASYPTEVTESKTFLLMPDSPTQASEK